MTYVENYLFQITKTRYRIYPRIKIKPLKRESVYFLPKINVNANKRRLAKFNGVSRKTFPLHLKECELRYNFKGDILKILKVIISF